ncbi:serine protease [Saccharothrix sp. S26]|uniref:S1 family peptidase n=1 Tax=Saccharothrix sp. S26 TaxID=2907215 RepID=UPI001F280BC8|nr:serine protease [Saccharothrix sp. S26]MCE6998163.1 serine protease [Saccharothrix sp. S26]
MTTTTERPQDPMAAVEHLARVVAGDDEQRFALVYHAFANQVDGFLTGDGADGYRLARTLLRRGVSPLTRSAVGTEPPTDSIYTDPVYLANMRALVGDRARIIGGVPTADFPECVAVGSPNVWCCSGTLVSPNVVVTAGHCVEGGCAARVFLGKDVEFPEDGEVIRVRTALAHPDYRPPKPTCDLAVLVLERPASTAPRPIATRDQVAAAAFVRLAGYGNTDVHSSGGYGRRRMVDVPIAGDHPRYGADAATEFVAGAPFLDRDSCNGDSGGPAYVQSDGQWLLAGATSRATASSLRPCGDGGIYTRVASYQEWVWSVPGASRP